MSLRALVVPEDPTYNGYILEPLVARLFESAGRAAKTKVLTNPRMRGYEHAKRELPAVLAKYSHFDFVLFLPDADGRDRSGEFERLQSDHPKLLCCAAVQEVETWLLAAQWDRLKRTPGHEGATWAEVRADVSVKERAFADFLREHGNSKAPGGGRERLVREGLVDFDAILKRSPELRDLRDRVRDRLP